MKKVIVLFLFLILLTIGYYEYNLLNKYFIVPKEKKITSIVSDDSIKQLNNYIKIKINTKEYQTDIKDYINSYIIYEIVELKISDNLSKNLYNEINKMDLKLKEFINNYKDKEQIKNKVDITRNITSSLEQNILKIKVNMYITTPYTEPIYYEYEVSVDIKNNKIINETNELMLSKEQINNFTDFLFLDIKKHFNENNFILENKKITLNDYINNREKIINNLIININKLNYYINNNIIYTEYKDEDIFKYMNISFSSRTELLSKINIYKFE